MFSFDHTSTDIAKLGVISPEDAYLKENPRQLLSDDNVRLEFFIFISLKSYSSGAIILS